MRVNHKFYALAEGKEPFIRQEFDGRLVDLYYMNDFEIIYNQSIPQGRFALWSSLDGFNYRLFIEKDFYEELNELYTAPVNKLWLDYWDKVDKFTRLINFKILLPIAIALIAILILLSQFVSNSKVSMGLQIGFAAAFIIAMFTSNSYAKRKTQTYHHECIDAIKKHVGGEKKFDHLLKTQTKFIDDYLAKKAKEQEEKYYEEYPEEKPNDEVIEIGVPANENDFNQELEDVKSVEESSLDTHLESEEASVINNDNLETAVEVSNEPDLNTTNDITKEEN